MSMALRKTNQKLEIDKLKPYGKNNKVHTEQGVSQLLENYNQVGIIDPIIVDESYSILAGHKRWLAAKAAGQAVVDCLVVEGLTEEQKRIYRIANNKLTHNSDWDFNNLEFELEQLKDFDLDALGINFDLSGVFDEPEIVEDEVPEVDDSEPITPKGAVWLLGKHRVVCGDSTNPEEVDKLMQGQKADLVFTDPPYGVSYADKNKYLNTIAPSNRIQTEIENDHMNLEDTSEFIFKAFCQIKRNLADRSSYYITAPQGGDLMMMMMMMQKAEIPLRHCLIWVKNNHVLGRTDYNYKHEPILFGWDKVHDFYGKGEHKFSTWEIDKPLKNDLHPTMKPVALVCNALLNSSQEGNICLDLFLGSGTTLVACEQLGRICYGMEISPKYCDVIVERWQKLTGKEATLEGSDKTYNQLKEAANGTS